MTSHKIIAPKKLIEVALPLDNINDACAKEKSNHHGHPSTLHLWWARRPLAAARAVIFAQLVNDPSWKYSEQELRKPAIKGSITKKRTELFKLMSELVKWSSTTDEAVLSMARAEIRASWKETCEANRDHPDADTRFNPDRLPEFHDPFAGGGAIPLEAQRLGLKAHATDLNPVAVLINKALLEIPPKFNGRAPVGPLPVGETQTVATAVDEWPGTLGLAEDVRRYGVWMRGEALSQLAGLYPHVRVTKEMIKNRPELAALMGREYPVLAWLWARTVASPNPVVDGAHVPLISSLFLSSKDKEKIWLKPVIGSKGLTYTLVAEKGAPPTGAMKGTVGRQGAICLLTQSPIPFTHIRSEGQAGRMGWRLLAVVVQSEIGRIYLAADEMPAKVRAAHATMPPTPTGLPVVELPEKALGFRVQQYGITRWSELFLPRQLQLLSVLGSLLHKVYSRCSEEADPEYGLAIVTMLSLCVSKMAVFNNAIGRWRPGANKSAPAFGRQAISMIWDTPEVNPFGGGGGDWQGILDSSVKAIQRLPGRPPAEAAQRDASGPEPLALRALCVSTDPPYYDNVAYADLSDFSYYWIRQFLGQHYPEILGTIKTPKDAEIIADPFRRGGRAAARTFFLMRMGEALRNVVAETSRALPVTLYYAFKQTDDEEDDDEVVNQTPGASSTAWETFLEATISAGLAVTATWPMRTEGKTRLRGQNANALASSIVLVCRVRTNTTTIARKEFLRELDRTLPAAIAEITADPVAAIAPVDLAQACIGPGMAIFSRHASVIEADGTPMTVHRALVHINKAIDDYFSQAEGDLDADTRFCIGWFDQFGFETGAFGDADVLARAKGTSVDGVKEAGVVSAARGKVRLFKISELPKSWDPTRDNRVPIWEACHQMCRALGESERAAGALLVKMQAKQEAIRLLAYRLYTLCERKKWAEHARAYNELITSWPAIVEASTRAGQEHAQLDLPGS